MKQILFILITLVILSCKSDNKNIKEESKKETTNANSRVIVTLNEMDYSAAVTCTYFEEDYFYFKSDKLETTDTNGDGLVITGHQQDDKMVLTVIAQGKTYSANLGIHKKENTALGAGKLFLKGTTESVKTTYKVICN